MAPIVFPWVALVGRDADSPRADVVRLYEPYYDGIALELQPASVSMIGWEQLGYFGQGLSTSLNDTGGGKVICNFLQSIEVPTTRPRSFSRHGKRAICIESELTTKFLTHICLEISDVICIKAQTASEAVHTILSFRDCLDSGETRPEAQFIIFLVASGSSIESSEAYIIEKLQALIKDDDRSEWTSRTVQNMIVRECEPKLTRYPEILATIETYITSAKKRRDAQNHLWTLQQLMYLVEQYFTRHSPFILSHQKTRRRVSQWPGATWYPMAFRRQFWPGDDVDKHNGLTQWFEAADDDIDLNVSLAPIFARMFLVDGCMLAPGMFSQSDVGKPSVLMDLELPHSELFASIYEPLCRDAWSIAAQGKECLFHQSLEGFLYAVVSGMGLSNPSLQKKAVRGLRKVGGNSFCSMCPWDMPPSVVFKCGHGICERDAWYYSGIPIGHPGTLAHYEVCPVCSEPMNLQFRLRPLQAGYRVAAFDGGGTLAVAELAGLKCIVETLPKALSPHHYFDYVAGTSAGSIIATGVFIMQWPLKDCIKAFRATAKEVFVKKRGVKALARRIFGMYRSGAQYDFHSFCKILKDRYGDTLLSKTAERGKEAVLVALTGTTPNAKLCLFRSYGDVLLETENGDYSTKAFPDLLIWQAVSTSCAAPLMFAPSDYPLKACDGLFKANCPAGVALMEVNKLSMLNTRQLDFCISFGTGNFLGADQKQSSQWASYLIPEWVQNLAGYLGEAVDAASMYRQLVNTLDRSEVKKHHRVEPCFAGLPVAQDDPTKIKSLEQKTTQYMRNLINTGKFDRLRLAMMACCFYGALQSPPEFDASSGQYLIKLTVLSRWPEDDMICNSLYEKLRTASFVVESRMETRMETRTYNYKTSPLNCNIRVSNLDMPIDINLRLDGKSHPISGFPLSITQMIYLQHPTRKRGGSSLDRDSNKRRRGEKDVI